MNVPDGISPQLYDFGFSFVLKVMFYFITVT